MTSAPILEAESLDKRFGATQALRGVGFQVQPGEVRALLGHNGSGKSTVIKILAGYHCPDRGRVTLHGADVRLPVSRDDTRRHALGILHQDLALAETMSVLENVAIQTLTLNRFRKIAWKREREATSRLLHEVGLDIDPALPVARLSAAERVIVAIARAFRAAEDAEVAQPVIVLDEPTAALGDKDVARLFASIRRVSRRGCALVFVTHRPAEVLGIADTVTVLRDGVVVSDQRVERVTPAELSSLISSAKGPSAQAGPAAARVPPRPGAIPALAVSHLTGEVVRGLSLDVHAGEIVGLTGLRGSGFEEVPGLIFGARRPRRAQVIVHGQPLRRCVPWRSVRSGLAFVSGDRLREGGVATASLAENVAATNLNSLAVGCGWISRKREHALAADVMASFNIRAPGAEAAFAALSGGNQQKALIARWLRGDAKVLLMHEPTAGVDIGSVTEILAMLRSFAARGGAVLIATGQTEDLAGLCDRLLVLANGKMLS